MILTDPAAVVAAAALLRVILIAALFTVRGRPEAVRRLAFGGSAAASLMTGLAAVTVLATGVPARGVLFVHAASGGSSGRIGHR